MHIRWKVSWLVLLTVVGGWSAIHAQQAPKPGQGQVGEPPSVSVMQPSSPAGQPQLLSGVGIVAESRTAVERAAFQAMAITLGQFVMAYTNNGLAPIYGILQKEGQEYRLVPTAWDAEKVEADLFSPDAKSSSLELPVGHITLTPMTDGPYSGWRGQLMINTPGEADARSLACVVLSPPATAGMDVGNIAMGKISPASVAATLVSMGYLTNLDLARLFPPEGALGTTSVGKGTKPTADVRQASPVKIQDHLDRKPGSPTPVAPESSSLVHPTTTRTDSSSKMGPSTILPGKKDSK